MERAAQGQDAEVALRARSLLKALDEQFFEAMTEAESAPISRSDSKMAAISPGGVSKASRKSENSSTRPPSTTTCVPSCMGRCSRRPSSAGVAETVALSRARGQAVTQSVSRKRLQPYRRQSGLEWLAAKGRIGAEAKAAGERYGWAYRRLKLEKAIPSTPSDRVRGAFVAPDLEEVLAHGEGTELARRKLATFRAQLLREDRFDELERYGWNPVLQTADRRQVGFGDDVGARHGDDRHLFAVRFHAGLPGDQPGLRPIKGGCRPPLQVPGAEGRLQKPTPESAGFNPSGVLSRAL